MIEAGWMRPWFYRWAGGSASEAYVKEMELVRRGVGLSDVSSLGKIDIQGPDAAEFVNRVYVNGFSRLGIGKARYGVMLHDDGLVLDDGTTTRLSETRFFMTTTTAQAGEVMSWLEFLLQAAWPELRVHVTSLTDEWAGMAISGPKAREALALAFPGLDLSDASLPYMGAQDGAHEGIPVRFVRLSFSGELAYEVYASTISEWAREHVLERARASHPAHGLRPGVAASRGHVAAELDHRNNRTISAWQDGCDKSLCGGALRHRPLERLIAGRRDRGPSRAQGFAAVHPRRPATHRRPRTGLTPSPGRQSLGSTSRSRSIREGSIASARRSCAPSR
jgi:sarcosine oxidase subunit alpha